MMMVAAGLSRLGVGLRLVVVFAVLCALSLALASRAEAYVYWVNQATGSIGRANLDGTGVNQNFITGIPGAEGVAVDPGRYNYNGQLVPLGTHIYWTDSYGIGRANLDGSGVDMKFIQGLKQLPVGVAAYNSEVDSPSGWPFCFQEMLVWTEWPMVGTTPADSKISFAQLPGCLTGSTPYVYEGWIGGLANGANAIAAGAMDSNWARVDSGRVYWTALLGRSIGRTNLDFVQPALPFTESFITTSTNYTVSEGVAVRQEALFCATCGHIYWVNGVEINIDPGGSIGRANLDGSGVNQNFISLPPFYTPEGVAVDAARYDLSGNLITTGGHIYFTMPGANSIGIANLDGTGVNKSFITGAAKPWGIAVDATSGAGGGPGQTMPTSKEQCKHGGWRNYPGFKNEGDCIRYVATHGKKLPGG